MSLSRLWLFLAVALPVLGSLLATMSTVDLAYHLRAGAEILAARALPSADSWTFTAAGEPWVDQQWGAQLVLRSAEALGGWTALAVLRAALIGAIFGLLLVIIRRSGLGPRVAAGVTLAAFAVALPALALRPQLLGIACFAVVLLLVVDRHTHPRRLWLVPVVVAVWANLHGSFFLGPVVLVLAWFGDLEAGVARPHRTLAVALTSVAAACLTPFGPLVWAYAIGLSVNPEVTARITEWQPTSIRTVPGMLFFGSALATAALLARIGRTASWSALAWLAAFFVLGVYAERGLAWWPLAAATVLAPVIATRIGTTTEPARADPPIVRRMNAVLAGALVLAGIALLPAWRGDDPGTLAPRGSLAHAPSSITAVLRREVRDGDHVFNPQTWGSWFEYAIPAARYAIDSRIELFPPSVWDQVEAVSGGVDGWQEQLRTWEVDLVVTTVGERAFADRLVGAGWEPIHEAADGAVFAAPGRTIGMVPSRTGPLDSDS